VADPVEPKWDAVLFDLDGTLLELSMTQFLEQYLTGMAQELKDHLDPDRLPGWVQAAVRAVLLDTRPDISNEEVFWEAFRELSGADRNVIMAAVDSFHRRHLPALRHLAEPAPGARRAVDAARRYSRRLVLATQPLYPAAAIGERVRWAGLAPAEFHLITSMENMWACKPWVQYYQAILDLVGAGDPRRVLMVGNDPILDMAAGSLGIHTFLLEPPPGKGPAMEVRWLAEAGLEGVTAVPRPTYLGRLEDVPDIIKQGPAAA